MVQFLIMRVPSEGFQKGKNLKKYILNIVSLFLASDTAVYGELGRYPMFITRYIQIIKCWFKLLQTDIIISKVIQETVLH